MNRGEPFIDALRTATIPVIAEFKRSSPSLGPFAKDSKIHEQLRAYVEGGAAAFSILAEPSWFMGRPEDFAVATGFGRPVLYKGFVGAAAHLDEARALGSGAVLLIARVLREWLPAFADAARLRGLEPFVEVHHPEEVPFVEPARVRMVGWNARDLSNFTVRKSSANWLRESFPDALIIRESGLRTPEDACDALREGYDGLLIGESLMRLADPAHFLAQIRDRIA